MAKLPFLHIKDAVIVDESGRPVRLRGVALGGWLMMEGYMSCGRNIAEKEFKAAFKKALGGPALADFEKSFRGTFITEDDIRLIRSWGANCVRVPFNFRVVEFEDRPFSRNKEGIGYLDRIVRWCEKHGLYCVLDLHAAPGSQNTDWHSDTSGVAELFTNPLNIERFIRIWQFIANRYEDSSAVAGYDLLNEPVISIFREKFLKDLYEKTTAAIRQRDSRHIIFLEGNYWGQRLECLGKPKDANTAFSIHAYPAADYSFNLEEDLRYPGMVGGVMYNKALIGKMTARYASFMKKTRTPLYVGELGVKWRGGCYGEVEYIKDIVDILEKNRCHWMFWTYKTVANPIFAEGLLRYTKNPAWVNRKGPLTGWETFSSLWPSQRKNIIESWRTKEFKQNDKLLALLKKYFKK